MVVPIRELANKQLFTSTISSKLSNMAHLPFATDMNINNITRGRSTSSSKMSSRSTSVVSDASSIPYHLRIEINNDLLDKITVEPIDSSQLSYQDNVKRRSNLVSEAADPGPIRKSQHVQHDALALDKAPKPQGKSAAINNTNTSLPQENVISIQLPYDPNQPTEKNL